MTMNLQNVYCTNTLQIVKGGGKFFWAGARGSLGICLAPPLVVNLHLANEILTITNSGAFPISQMTPMY